MNYFIDTEFLEGTQKAFFGKTKPTIDLISIGIVSEDSREYYAISKDFNLKEAWNRWQQRTGEGDRNNTEPRLYWLRENVLKPIYKELHNKENLTARQAFHRCNIYIPETEFKFTYSNFKKLINKYGKTNKQIAEEVKVFCTGDVLSIEKAKFYEVQHKPFNFYGYYSAYDHVVLCWLFGKMIDLPTGFPRYTIDLKQELDLKARAILILNMKGAEHFEGALQHLKALSTYPFQTNEHNALSDARFNRDLYKFLQNI